MAVYQLFLLFFLVLALFQFPTHISSSHVAADPDSVAEEVNWSIRNATDARRKLGYQSCQTGNPIDDCWRCDPQWHKNRKRLADCGIGFGKQAIGGRNGKYYLVTDSSDNPFHPKPGTLRHAVIQNKPLWIVFAGKMLIRLKAELLVNSYKTIDGRGTTVHIAGGPCIRIQYVTNVIIHGINIHYCRRGRSVLQLRDYYYSYSTAAMQQQDHRTGDGIHVYGGKHIWIDHCWLTKCADGLIDVTHGSTAVTISNNYMTDHNKVMLLGHSDRFAKDKYMQVTVAFNHFGPGLVQRMPRCRHGYFHVVNNDYLNWGMYAIGGSAAPTINSQGNRFLAPDYRFHKEVTKREAASKSEWMKWNWRSEGDLFLNGAFFTSSGSGSPSSYAKASSLPAKPSNMVASITANAGPLVCKINLAC